MLIKFRAHKKAQNTAEYAILIALVVGAVIAMQTYTKRGLQARQYDATRNFVGSINADSNWAGISNVATSANYQYEPQEVESRMTQEVVGTSTQNYHMAGGGTTSRTSNQITTQAAGDFQTQHYNNQ